MLTHSYHPLRPYNTFHINAYCDVFYIIENIEDLYNITAQDLLQCKILGGGSNILMLHDIKSPILYMQIKGKEIIHEDQDTVHLKIGGGEIWSDFVDYCAERDWNGIENLALIPGTVGACPIQNIGAYGREVKDVIHKVHYFDKSSKTIHTLTNAECQFGYRDSIFKNELKDKCIIVAVEFILSKKPQFHLEYGPLQELKQQAGTLKARTIAEQVKSIRRSKLPNPEHIGNGGSFFKNPVISREQFETLLEKYPEMPHFLQEDGVKVPAAWLIEQCGWKGFRENDYGVHQHQALVLVNYGQATGEEIFELSDKIIDSVKNQFNIILEREINIWK